MAEDWRAKIKEDFPLDFKHLTNWIEANIIKGYNAGTK
jgi:DNA-binding transcriptional regulator WhiA